MYLATALPAASPQASNSQKHGLHKFFMPTTKHWQLWLPCQLADDITAWTDWLEKKKKVEKINIRELTILFILGSTLAQPMNNRWQM